MKCLTTDAREEAMKTLEKLTAQGLQTISGRDIEISRRAMIAGGGTLGLGAALAASPVLGQARPAGRRIDVHHHFIPPFHVEAMTAPGRRAGPPPPKP